MKHCSSGFDAFWQAYPQRVAKLAAEKAYVKALKLASHEELMEGIARYVASKPDWQAYAHPASWLNAGRWMDEVKSPHEPTAWHCPHDPHCLGRSACDILRRLGR